MKREKNIRFPLFRERFLQLKGERTTVEFAQVLGMSRATVGFYESGQRIPDALGIEKICKTCGVSADWLLGISIVKTSDTTTQAICQATGLSESAVKKLIEMKQKNFIKGQNDALSSLLETMESDLLLDMIAGYYDPVLEKNDAIHVGFVKTEINSKDVEMYAIKQMIEKAILRAKPIFRKEYKTQFDRIQEYMSGQSKKEG